MAAVLEVARVRRRVLGVPRCDSAEATGATEVEVEGAGEGAEAVAAEGAIPGAVAGGAEESQSVVETAAAWGGCGPSFQLAGAGAAGAGAPWAARAGEGAHEGAAGAVA